MAAEGGPPLLAVEDLCVDYAGANGPTAAVEGVSFTVERGEILGLAGESGSGKSTLARALLRLLPAAAVVRRGQVLFEGGDVLAMSPAELRSWRGRRVSMVPQDAMNALNPLLRVADQLEDVVVAHERDAGAREARRRAEELLDLVGVARARLGSYPHELSGGMRQRVVIAMALALRPDLVILDEPTTALDVLVKNEILGHLAALREELGFSALFIGHDLAAMFELCGRVGVLQAGRLVELAPAARVRGGGEHPYTRALVRCLLDPHRPRAGVGS